MPAPTLPSQLELLQSLKQCLNYIECSEANRGLATNAAEYQANVQHFRATTSRIQTGRGYVPAASVDLARARELIAQSEAALSMPPQQRNGAEPLTSERIRQLLGDKLGQALVIAESAMLSCSGGEASVSVVRNPPKHPEGEFSAVECTLTHRTLLASGSEADASAAAIAHMVRKRYVALDCLLQCTASAESSRAFAHGVHASVGLIEHFAAQAGVHPDTSANVAHEICSQLGVLRDVDLRLQLEMKGWNAAAAAAAGNLHTQLLKAGYVGWNVDDAEQTLRGGADARAGLDDLEARLGIDVSRMREAVTFVGSEASDEVLSELCEEHGLTIRQDGIRFLERQADNWEWVNADDEVSEVWFASWREAAVSALETRFLPEYHERQQGECLLDFMQNATPAIRLIPW